MTDARTVTKALGGKWHSSGAYGLAKCPAHDDREPSLSIRDGDAELIVKCHAGCAWRDVKDALRQRGLLDSFAPGQPQPCRPLQRHLGDEEDERKRSDLALALWEPSVSLRDTIAWKYLTERRQLHVGILDDLSHCLRWNARVGALLALMTDPLTGAPTGIHRTYLNSDGMKRARQMLGKRGVIRLSPDEDVETNLGIAEGIEDGLRILLSGYQPVWVGTCADGIKSFPVVLGIEALTVFADNDEPGLEAAEVCVRRWIQAGRQAVICTPRKY